MRALLINPNTTAALTARMAGLLRPHLPSGCEIVAATGRFGAPYISTPHDYARGAEAARDALARHPGCDVVMLGCFGDPGLDLLRAASPAPVVGMASAACAAAARAGRFSIVTGGAHWPAMLTRFVDDIGLGARLASVRATILTGGEIAADPHAALDALAACVAACVADGAEAVVLGGAGLAGLAAPLRPRCPVPLIDSLDAMGAAAAAALRARPPYQVPSADGSTRTQRSLDRMQ